jgi:hypothetical protein
MMRLHQFAVSGFAYKLSAQQREALLQLLVYMAGIDYEITIEEEAFLIEWAKEWQLPLDLTPEEDISEKQLLALFDTYEAKVIALQEIIKLAYQDGHYGEEERDKVQAFATRLGLANYELLSEINRWVRVWFDWHYTGEQMLIG